MNPRVAIIVLTWNQRELTLDCLDSLVDLDYPTDRLEVIVVDNNSADGTAQAIRKQFPQVMVLENGENLGFADGNNVGIRHAMSGSAEYVMLLNNDTVVEAKLLQRLIAVAESDERAGIVTPKIYYYDVPERIWCAGASIDLRTSASQRLRADEYDRGQDENVQEVAFASGCAICVKRAVIEQIGLLDSRFFIYYEETDWCMRARAADWRILYVPDARLWHKVSAAMGTASPATEYYMNRNALLFLAKHRQGLPHFGSLMLVCGRSLLAVAAYSVKPEGGSRLPHRDARLLALRDALLGRWGKMGPDVAAVCYPDL